MSPQFVSLFILAVLAIPASARALAICPETHSVSHGDSVISAAGDTFVICSQPSGADTLVKLTRPAIAIKVSSPPPQPPKPETEPSLDAVQDTSAKACQSAQNDVYSSDPATIFFGFNDTGILTDQRKALDALPLATPLTVTGFTCSIGPKKYNQKLSERRAQAVAEYLRQRGAIVAHVEGKGECCPASTTDMRQNRRVEIKKKEKN